MKLCMDEHNKISKSEFLISNENPNAITQITQIKT